MGEEKTQGKLNNQKSTSQDSLNLLNDLNFMEAQTIMLANQASDFVTLAHQDDLTSLGNRRSYEMNLNMPVVDKNRFVAVAVDINGLRDVNDTFGHDAGDELICGVASCLKHSLGSYGDIYRIGGNEFIALLYVTEIELDYILKDFERNVLAWSSEKVKELSISYAYALQSEYPELSIKELVKIAEDKMYDKKTQFYENRGVKKNSRYRGFISSEFGELINKIPDQDYDVEHIIQVFRECLPDIAKKYGVVRFAAQIEEVSVQQEGIGNIGTSIVLYDDRKSENEETNDLVSQYEIAQGGHVIVTTSIPKLSIWTPRLKQDMIVLSRTIYLLIGRAKAMNSLMNLLFSDQMTGVANVTQLHRYMGMRLEDYTFYKYNINFVNIKNMKLLNNRHGERAGDQILIQFAKKLDAFVGETGCVARFGGDNFAVYLEKERQAEFLSLLEKMAVTLSFPDGRKEEIKVDSRVGYYDIEEGANPLDCIRYSEVAMRLSKNGNYNDVLEFQYEMMTDMLRIKTLEDNIPDAIKNKEFIVYYQPKADVSEEGNYKLCGAEALVRWSKDGRIVPPMEFIPVLEKNGLVTLVDLYMFEKVCQDIRSWEERGLKPVRVSSNFSRRHLRDKHFADKIEAIVRRYDVDPAYLEIEITESYESEDMEALTNFERRMHAMGINLSLDDFGSGFSSLKMVKNIVADTIKLDKSLIDGVGEGNGDDIIVKHIIDMILSLGKELIAEGVEYEKQAAFLRDNGCTMIQGYLYGKPMPREDFEKLMERDDY